MSNRLENIHVSRRGFVTTMGLGVGALAIPGLLAACSPIESAGPNPAAGKPTYGGSLRVGLFGGSAKDSLDALRAVTEADMARSIQLFDTLLTHDDDFNVQPGLAEEVEGSADATEWTIRLREGVEFHNGKSLTAADVAATLRFVTDPDNPGAGAARLANMDRDGMEIMDERTLRVRFATGYAAFVDALADAGTSAFRVVPEDYDVRNPVGTGPFTFESFTPGERSVFKKNPNFWRNGEPYVDEVILINLTDDAARVNALISGQVDAIASVPTSQIQVLEANSDFGVVNSETGGWNPITMRVDIAPFNDARVREAFRLIADRQQMVDQVLAGRGTPANDIFARFDPAYNSGLAQRKIALDKAKSLLAEAGQSNMEIQLVTAPVAAGLVEAAQSFAEMAAQAGVKVNVLKVDGSTFFSKHFINAPLSQSYWATRNYLLQAADSMLPESPYNETHWANEEWQQLVNTAFQTIDDTERTNLIQRAQEIEHREGGYINWGWYDNADGVRKGVNGFVPNKAGISLSSYRLRTAWMS